MRAAAGRYRAFIPNQIADEDFDLTGASAELAERAASAVRELNRQSGQLVSLEGLARQLLRSEALASSQIEGLSISHRKLAESELAGREGHYKASEIMGTVRAMERAIEIGTGTEGFSIEDITAIHREIAIVPPLDRIAGRLREEVSWIGGAAPPDADYVGPPHEHVRPLLDDLCDFMQRDDLPAVQQSAIAHAQFELIHPFGDGNGRVGRCLIHVILHRRGLARFYVPPVSIVLGANKDAYISGLRRYQEGSVDIWSDQFSRSVRTAAAHAASFSDQVIALQKAWRDRLGTIRSDSAALPLIELLPRFPILTAALAEVEIGRSRPATISALDRLASAGILSRHRNQRKGDSWEAKELFALLSEFEEFVRRAPDALNL